MKEEPKFHVIMCGDNPKKGGDPIFVYVGTPEEASLIGMDLQKKIDTEDRVNSKWKRKRHCRIESPEGQIGPETLQSFARVSGRQDHSIFLGIDKASPEGGKSAFIEVEDGVIVDVNKDS